MAGAERRAVLWSDLTASMNAFELLIALLLRRPGYWISNSFTLELRTPKVQGTFGAVLGFDCMPRRAGSMLQQRNCATRPRSGGKSVKNPELEVQTLHKGLGGAGPKPWPRRFYPRGGKVGTSVDSPPIRHESGMLGGSNCGA